MKNPLFDHAQTGVLFYVCLKTVHHMAHYLPKRKILRISFVTYPVLCVAISLMLRKDTTVTLSVLDCLLAVNLLFCFYPMSFEKETASAVFALIAAALMFPGLALRFSLQFSVPACIVLCVYLFYRLSHPVSDFRSLFRVDILWQIVERGNGSILSVLAISLNLFRCAGIGWPLIPVSALLAGTQHYCAYTGHTVLLGREKEKTLKNAIKGDLRTSAAANPVSDPRAEALYSRVVEYMDTRKPYLQEDFNLSMFAKCLFTNRTYLSHVINCYSGRNFKQFVNYYRVKYSVDLIRKDPHLSVMELASMSGFHSVVTFNMAFRANMNDTPGAFSRCCPRDS